MRLFCIHIVLLCVVGLSACKRVVLSLDKVPKNTPKGAQIYVAGSFNNWNPGDPNYMMLFDEETHQYSVNLPMGFGNIDYKFTRGDWTTVESDACGGEISNRKLAYAENDYHNDSILGWQDLEPENCERVTFIIDKLPPNTPKLSKIYLGGNINAWECNSDRFLFRQFGSGQLILTVPRNSDKLIFKITRGTWESTELNETGNEQLQREFLFGQKDTVHLTVHSWADMPLEKIYTKTIILESLPKGTPNRADIFLASSLNNWNPLDGKSKFTVISGGRRMIKVSFTAGETFMYKVTRGGWESVETDAQFRDIENRELVKSGKDTVYIKVEAWADKVPQSIRIKNSEAGVIEASKAGAANITFRTLSPSTKVNIAPLDYDKRKKVFIIIDKMPEFGKGNTLYLAGDFNGWKTMDENYQFRNLPNGRKYILLRLDDNEQHEFKITRGGWDREEANFDGTKHNNRIIVKQREDDTLHITIQRWFDESDQRQLVMMLTVDQPLMSASEGVYLTGDFNDWFVKDEQYRFKRINENRYVLTITDFSKRYGLYKITRGSWETEATTKTGRIPDNQLFKANGTDTIKVRIERWKDM